MKRASAMIARAAVAVGAACFFAAGCHTDMWRQPRAMPQASFDTTVFPDGKVDRPPVEGTVAWGKLRIGDPRYTAREGRKLVTKLPPSLVVHGETLSTSDPADLEKIIRRGRERFEIFCVHCHGALGDGKGMITQRGLALRRKPATYHTDRLRKMPIGHFFDVITNGYGAMFSYASRVDVDDRWAIAAYIRALQLSQNAPASIAPPEELDKASNAATPVPSEQEAHSQ